MFYALITTKTLFTRKFGINEKVPANVDVSEMSNGKLNVFGSVCQSRITVREDCLCEKPVAPNVSISDPMGRLTTSTLFSPVKVVGKTFAAQQLDW